MENFKNLVIEELEQKLEDYEGANIYGADMSYTLLEQYNIDGTYTYNSYESKQMIKTYFDELGDVYDNYLFNFGKEASINVFEEPENFILLMLLEKANELLSDCEFINDNWNNNIELTEENIKTIKNQLESLK